jgi:hypothetical protein
VHAPYVELITCRTAHYTTLLILGAAYSQVLSCYTFSVLRGWLEAVYGHGRRSENDEVGGRVQGGGDGGAGAASGDGGAVEPDELTDIVKEAIVEYDPPPPHTHMHGLPHATHPPLHNAELSPRLTPLQVLFVHSC